MSKRDEEDSALSDWRLVTIRRHWAPLSNLDPSLIPGFTSTFTRGFIPVVLRTPAAECAHVLEPLGRLE